MSIKSYFHPWIVAVSASVSSGIAASYVQTAHLMVEDIKDTFNVSYKDASLIPSVSLALMYLSLVGNPFFTYFGFRRTVMGAGLVAALAQIGAAYTDRFDLVVLLLGIVNGLCSTLAYNVPIIAVSQLFSGEDRSKAMTTVFFGSGIGMTVLPFITNTLLDSYGLRGTMLILSGFTLNIVVAGATMPGLENRKTIGGEISGETEKSMLAEANSKTDDIGGVSRSWKRSVLGLLQLDVISNWRVLAMKFYGAQFALTFSVVTSFSYSILMTDYGLSAGTIVSIVSAAGLCSLGAKFSLLFLRNSEAFPRWWAAAVTGTVVGLCMGLLAICGPTGAVGGGVLMCMLYMGFAMLFSLFAISLTDLFPIKDFPVIYGYNVLVMMISTLISPILTGWMADVTDSFMLPLLFTGTLAFVTFLIPSLLYQFYRLCHKKPECQPDSESEKVLV